MKTSFSLTEGSLFKGIFLFSLPLILSNILQVLFNFADVATVGHFVGASALGSVGSTTILITCFTGFAIGFGNGINAVVARFFGAKDGRSADESVKTALVLSLLFGVVIAFLGVALAQPMLSLLGTKEELLDGAVLYFSVYILGMPGLMAYNCGAAVFEAVGDTKKPLIILSSAGILNVIMNLVTVLCFDMGVMGVGVASSSSQTLSGVLCVFALNRGTIGYKLSFKSFRFSHDKARRILSLSIPSGIQNTIFGLANLFIQGGVNSFDALTVEGNSAAVNSDALVYDVMAAYYMACSSFMSQNYGAGKRDRVLKSYLISVFYAFISGAVMGVTLVVFGRSFLSLFTSDPEVIESGMTRLTVMGMSYMISAFMDGTIAASRSLGHSTVPTIIVIMGSCVFRVIWVYTIFAHFHTIFSLYALYSVSWSLTAIFEIAYFVKVYRKMIVHLP